MTPEQQAESDKLDAEIRDHQIADAIACVRREWAMRQRVYPGMVARGRLKPTEAAREVIGMRLVLRLLVEMRCGHATPEYVATLEAYGVYDHDGGHA